MLLCRTGALRWTRGRRGRVSGSKRMGGECWLLGVLYWPASEIRLVQSFLESPWKLKGEGLSDRRDSSLGTSLWPVERLHEPLSLLFPSNSFPRPWRHTTSLAELQPRPSSPAFHPAANPLSPPSSSRLDLSPHRHNTLSRRLSTQSTPPAATYDSQSQPTRSAGFSPFFVRRYELVLSLLAGTRRADHG